MVGHTATLALPSCRSTVSNALDHPVAPRLRPPPKVRITCLRVVGALPASLGRTDKQARTSPGRDGSLCVSPGASRTLSEGSCRSEQSQNRAVSNDRDHALKEAQLFHLTLIPTASEPRRRHRQFHYEQHGTPGGSTLAIRFALGKMKRQTEMLSANRHQLDEEPTQASFWVDQHVHAMTRLQRLHCWATAAFGLHVTQHAVA